MQVTRPNEIRRPGVRLHPKACAALGLEAESATPKRLGTLVPRTCMHALGTGYARKSGEPLGFRPKEGTCASTGAHPPGETSTSRWRRSAPPPVARGRFVGDQQSGLAGCKPPPLFTRGASSCSSQGRRQGEPWGASPRPSAPTYLPWRVLLPAAVLCAVYVLGCCVLPPLPSPRCAVLCCAVVVWCTCVVLFVWSVPFLAPGALLRSCVLCCFLWCSAVCCCAALLSVWCAEGAVTKGQRPGCLPTGTGKRAGLCVLRAPCV